MASVSLTFAPTTARLPALDLPKRYAVSSGTVRRLNTEPMYISRHTARGDGRRNVAVLEIRRSHVRAGRGPQPGEAVGLEQ